MTDPLAEYTLDELWSEIKKRHDASVLVFTKELDHDREERGVWFSGYMTRCLGLVAVADEHLRVAMNPERMVEDDDE